MIVIDFGLSSAGCCELLSLFAKKCWLGYDCISFLDCHLLATVNNVVYIARKCWLADDCDKFLVHFFVSTLLWKAGLQLS